MLFALSDLHIRHPDNRAFIDAIEPHPEDWLILGGDLGESAEDLVWVIERLASRFAKLVWVPGNHELWSFKGEAEIGADKYARLVAVCQERGVLTPEDPYALIPGEPNTVLVPMFLLYDYSFRPVDVPREQALAWAMEHDVMCMDEGLLSPHPYDSREAWCWARVAETERRLEAIPSDLSTVLVNHFPLRKSHARLPAIPRFSLWCGTERTDDWHRRFRARAVVYGHLHIPRTHVDDGVPFEEVSLGYPRQWKMRDPARRGLRRILPRPERG